MTLDILGMVVHQKFEENETDYDDLDATVFHETRHLKHDLAQKGIAFPGVSTADTRVAGLMTEAVQFVVAQDANVPAGVTAADLFHGARLLRVIISEIDARDASIKAIVASNASNHSLREEIDGLVKYYIQLMTTLQDGVPLAARESPNAVVKLTGPIRKHLVDYLRDVHKNVAAPVRARVWNSAIDLRSSEVWNKVNLNFMQLPKPE